MRKLVSGGLAIRVRGEQVFSLPDWLSGNLSKRYGFLLCLPLDPRFANMLGIRLDAETQIVQFSSGNSALADTLCFIFSSLGFSYCIEC